jgi:hypothetical protein
MPGWQRLRSSSWACNALHARSHDASGGQGRARLVCAGAGGGGGHDMLAVGCRLCSGHAPAGGCALAACRCKWASHPCSQGSSDRRAPSRQAAGRRWQGTTDCDLSPLFCSRPRSPPPVIKMQHRCLGQDPGSWRRCCRAPGSRRPGRAKALAASKALTERAVQFESSDGHQLVGTLVTPEEGGAAHGAAERHPLSVQVHVLQTERAAGPVGDGAGAHRRPGQPAF